MALIKLYALVSVREQKGIREPSQVKENAKYVLPSIRKIKDMILTGGVVGCVVLFVVYVLWYPRL
jgi:hypothetical protein